MLLQLDNISFAYGPGPTVLDGISLDLMPGGRVALVGGNGSGKSTLLMHLNGLLQPCSGRVFWRGRDVAEADFDRAAWRRQVGFIFQQPGHQLFEETVAAEMAFGLRQLKLDSRAIAARTKEALEAAGLGQSGFPGRSPFSLSHGEQRRLALAAVLAMQPRLLVLDEATAGLDAEGTWSLLDRLVALAREGVGIVLATHDLYAAAVWADRVLLLDRGRLVRDGPPADLFQDTALMKDLGLEAPAPFRLIDYLRRRGRRQRAEEIEEILVRSRV